MESRRIQKVGSRSFAITLPKSWVSSNNLDQQDTIFIEHTKDNALIIRAKVTKEHDKEITINTSDIYALSEFIVLCYVKNMQRVVLSGKIDPKILAQLKQTISYLDGYDIVREDENGLVISFLFKDINVTIPIILQRMTYLIKTMVSSLEEGSSIEEFEHSLDRLYHLSKKIMALCMTNQTIRNENNVHNYESIFFLRSITKRLENIGDQLVLLKNKSIDEKEILALKKISIFLQKTLTTKQKVKDIKEEFQKISRHTNKNIDKIYDLCVDIMENKISLIYDEKFFS